ncbi:hypothetical protein GCM10009602_33530 [Nocardiopsis tropica]
MVAVTATGVEGSAPRWRASASVSKAPVSRPTDSSSVSRPVLRAPLLARMTCTAASRAGAVQDLDAGGCERAVADLDP